MNQRTTQVTFSSGEVAPEMYGRVDNSQYRAGVAKLQNFIPLPQGPARSRPGLKYIDRVRGGAPVDGPVKVTPFIYSTGDSVVIEMGSSSGAGYARFHTNGSPVTWASAVALGTLSATTVLVADPGSLVFTYDHKLEDGTQVVVGVRDGDTLPGGLSATEPNYTVIVVDARTIKLATAAATGGVEITTVGSGYFRIFKSSSLPTAWRPSLDSTFITAANVTLAVPPPPPFVNPNFARTIKYTRSNHGLVNGDVVRVSASSVPIYYSGPYNDYLSSTQDVYVVEADANTFKLSLTLGGAPIPFGGAMTPQVWAPGDIRLRYQAGRVYWKGQIVVGSPYPYQAGRGVYCQKDHNGQMVNEEITTADWLALPGSGVMEVPSPYPQADLFSLSTAQQNDVMTIASVNHPPHELQRLGPAEWRFVPVPIVPSIQAPVLLSVEKDYGVEISFVGVGGTTGTNPRTTMRFNGRVNLAVGDGLFCTGVTGGEWWNTAPYYDDPATGQQISFPIGLGVTFVVGEVIGGSSGVNECKLKSLEGDHAILFRVNNIPPLNLPATCNFAYTSLGSDPVSTYKVTAVDADGVESESSNEIEATNQLSSRGSSNTLRIAEVPGADHYRAYVELNGIYGYIGRTDTLTFVDDNIAPDLGQTPPRFDESITGTNYPRCVSAFEDRRVFAGTAEGPQTLWASRTGSLTDFTYRLPVLSEDRIKITLSSTDAQTIRHVVGLRDVLLLTQSGEWRMRGSNDSGVTPSNVFVRQEGFDGASAVSPALVNGQVVYSSDRGSHLRTVGFSSANGGLTSGDLSLRAPHLFDGYNITDLSASKSPYPIVWAVSSSSKLLGVTYLPEETVAGVHQHVTDGSFYSVAAVPEGDEDSVYVTVSRKDSSGVDVQTIERMQQFSDTSLDSVACVDSHVSTYPFAFSHGYTVQLQVQYLSTTMGVGSTVTLRAKNGDDTATVNVFSAHALGEEIRLFTSDSVFYRVRVSSYLSAYKVEATVMDDLPTSITESPIASGRWAYARTKFTVPSYLAGRQVTVLADGVASVATASSAGVVTLKSPALYVHLGLPYDSDIQTLPVAIQVDGFGMGRMKNVNKSWIRTSNTYRLMVGPDTSDLVPVDPQDVTTSPPATSGEQRTLLGPSWTEDGQLYVRQSSPYPATVVALTVQIAVGD